MSYFFQVHTRHKETDEWILCRAPTVTAPISPFVVTCEDPMTVGRFVMISVEKNVDLYLYEVGVFGTEINNGKCIETFSVSFFFQDRIKYVGR